MVKLNICYRDAACDRRGSISDRLSRIYFTSLEELYSRNDGITPAIYADSWRIAAEAHPVNAVAILNGAPGDGRENGSDIIKAAWTKGKPGSLYALSDGAV